MKIICLQENFKKGLNIVQNIIGKNLTLPILNNILLDVSKNKLKLSATDLELAVSSDIQCKSEKIGSITIPAKTLFNFVNTLPNKKIEISVKNNIINLKCENYQSSINGLNSKDFPIIPQLKNKPILEINSNKLKEILEQVINFVSFSDIRPEINGIFFNFSLEKNSKFVTTDSFRLGEKTVSLKINKQKGSDLSSIIIPYKTAQELIRIIGNQEKDENIKVIIQDNQILFTSNNFELISKLIKGNYPNYKQLITDKFETNILIEKEELVKAIKLSSFFSSKINDVRLRINSKKGIIEVFSQDLELGENLSKIKADIKGRDMEAIFNYKYLLDGLNSINSKKISIGFNSEVSPGIIKPEGDSSFTYVVMPIKL
ncbi:MAG: DNA polymerase III subunit beta [Patescibacteria group bacterium]